MTRDVYSGDVSTLGLSSRAGRLKPSPTLAITAKAKAMLSGGEDVIGLAAGEPDFNTPAPICDAAIEALRSGATKYTATSGTADLKKAICRKLERENGIHAEPANIVVSCGAKHSLYNALMVLVEPGDEVILIAPYWMTYAEQVTLAGGTPVIVQTRPDCNFCPDVEEIKAAITPRTKAILVNSPCNPTGAVFPRETLKAIAAYALRHNFWVITDEIYERLIYGATHYSIAAFGREIAERTITIAGFSKTFSMTGWRVGYACAPAPVASAISNLQDQVTSNPTSFAQAGAVHAYDLDDEEIERMRVEFQERRDLIIGELAQIPGVETPTPQGAFYVLPSFAPYIGGRFPTDLALAEYLLDEAKVAVIPGSVFEGAGHLRISYAASRDHIERGIQRIGEALQKIEA